MDNENLWFPGDRSIYTEEAEEWFEVVIETAHVVTGEMGTLIEFSGELDPHQTFGPLLVMGDVQLRWPLFEISLRRAKEQSPPPHFSDEIPDEPIPNGKLEYSDGKGGLGPEGDPVVYGSVSDVPWDIFDRMVDLSTRPGFRGRLRLSAAPVLEPPSAGFPQERIWDVAQFSTIKIFNYRLKAKFAR